MKKSIKAHLEQRRVNPDIIVKIEKLVDMQMRAQYSSEPAFSDFIDPETRHIMRQVLSETGFSSSYGGYQGAEYQQICFSDKDINTKDYPISLLAIKYQPKFGKIAHKDVLGTLMSLGLVRQKFGDIIIGEGIAYIFVCEDIADYVMNNITKIRRQGVKLSQLSTDDFIVPEVDFYDMAFTTASLRLDSVIAAAYKISRTQAVNLINAGEVKCNYSVQKSSAHIISIGDLISIRHKGRFSLDTVNGMSKKGKYKLIGRRTK